MPLSTAAQKLKLWLARYKITGTRLAARVTAAKNRGSFFTTLTEVVANETSLPAITGFTSVIQDNAIVISWGAVAGATNYQVAVSNDAALLVKKQVLYSGTALTYTITGLVPNTAHYIRLIATNTTSESVYFSAALTTLAPLAASASLTLSAVAQTTLTATWAAVTGAAGYILERSTNPGFTGTPTVVYTGALLTANDTGLSATTQYYYRVHATATNHNINTYTTNTATTTA